MTPTFSSPSAVIPIVFTAKPEHHDEGALISQCERCRLAALEGALKVHVMHTEQLKTARIYKWESPL